MSSNVAAILDHIQSLPKSEQQELWEELCRRNSPPARPGQTLYGEPLSDADIEDSARVGFQALDEEEHRAKAR